jgi:hypothetical protein
VVISSPVGTTCDGESSISTIGDPDVVAIPHVSEFVASEWPVGAGSKLPAYEYVIFNFIFTSENSIHVGNFCETI